MEKSAAFVTTNLMSHPLAVGFHWPRGLLVALLLLSPLNTHATELKAFTASYTVEKYNSVIGVATYQLTQDANKLHFSMRSKLKGLAALFRDDRVTEDSWLEHDQGKWQLLRYKYRQSGGSRDRETELSVAWAKDHTHGLVNGIHDDKKFTINITDDTRDALSFQLSLMRDAPGDGKLEYSVLVKDQLKQYIFARQGSEILELANQMVDTLIVERQQGDRTTRLWLAKQLQYLPVKIEQLEDGYSKTRMVIDRLTVAGNREL